MIAAMLPRRPAHFLAAILALTLAPQPAMASAGPLAASVAVRFDRQTISPVLTEGLADRRSLRPVTADDPVRIASISKLVAALGVMRLVDRGVLDLDRDVSDYLGWPLRHPGFPQVPVTLRLLLSHQSGLTDGADYLIPLGETLRGRLANPAAWMPPTPPAAAGSTIPTSTSRWWPA